MLSEGFASANVPGSLAAVKGGMGALHGRAPPHVVVGGLSARPPSHFRGWYSERTAPLVLMLRFGAASPFSTSLNAFPVLHHSIVVPSAL